MNCGEAEALRAHVEAVTAWRDLEAIELAERYRPFTDALESIQQRVNSPADLLASGEAHGDCSTARDHRLWRRIYLWVQHRMRPWYADHPWPEPADTPSAILVDWAMVEDAIRRESATQQPASWEAFYRERLGRVRSLHGIVPSIVRDPLLQHNPNTLAGLADLKLWCEDALLSMAAAAADAGAQRLDLMDGCYALRQIISINQEAAGLGSVIDYIRDMTGANIAVNWPALELSGIDRDTLISLTLTRVPSDHFLRIVLEQASAYAFDDEKAGFLIIAGIVQVSTIADLNNTVRGLPPRTEPAEGDAPDEDIEALKRERAAYAAELAREKQAHREAAGLVADGDAAVKAEAESTKHSVTPTVPMPVKKVAIPPEPTAKERRALSLCVLLGRTQREAAAEVWGSEEKQYLVSRAKKKVEVYAKALQLSGIEEWLEAQADDGPRKKVHATDPHKLELGRRTDGRRAK